MSSIPRLIRLPNLLIIALTMYLIRYCLIGKMLDLRGLWLGLPDIEFFLLVLGVMSIAAAGYIINDYFDMQADAINRPDKVVIGRKITREKAFKIYWWLNLLGIAIGFFLAVRVNLFALAIINPLSVGLLWFYTTTYKKKFLLGNIVIAALSALVPLMVGFFEPNRAFVNVSFIFIYAAFAFVISLIREIIKDMEDVEGDAAIGCRTVPIVLGKTGAKIIVVLLCLALLAFLGFVEYNQYVTKDFVSFRYFVMAISIPLAVLVFMTIAARTKEQFHKSSTLAKLVMVTGIFSTYIFYISF